MPCEARGGLQMRSPCDVTDLAAFAAAIAKADPYDVFFNNAGMNRPKPFVDVPVEDFDAIMGLNVRAAFFAAQAVVRKLIAAGKPGSIINMSSQMGHVGGANRSALLRLQMGDGGVFARHGDRTRAARHPRQYAVPDLSSRRR